MYNRNPAKGEPGTDIKPKKCIISVKYSVNSWDTSNGSAVLSLHCMQSTPGFTGIQAGLKNLNTEISVLDEHTKV